MKPTTPLRQCPRACHDTLPWLISFSLDRKEPAIKNGAQLLAGILFAELGVITVITGHIGSGTVREMQANGWMARFVGLLLLIMAATMLVDGIRKFRASRR